VLGDYRLVRFLDESPNMLMYHAVQQSVDRNVVLQLLKPAEAGDTAVRTDFKNLARAKANLVHQSIAPVFELLQSGEVLFYTGELLSGRNLDTIAKEGNELTTEQVFQIMVTISSAMVHIKSNGIDHRPLKGTDIHLDSGGQAHLANLALPAGAPNASMNEGIGIRKFIFSLAGVTPRGIASDLVDELRKLSDGRVLTWDGILRESRLARTKFNIGQANQLVGARAIATSWLKRGANSRILVPLLALGASLVLVVLAIGYALKSGSKTKRAPKTDYSSQINIPTSTITRDGEEIEVSGFSIDQHEVTIARYAEFLADTEGVTSHYDHPDQPASKSGHRPERWDELYEAAKENSRFNGQLVSLNCPIILVDWWDAYAFAAWEGRRLPTGIEWQIAAGGQNQLRFPWGDKASRANANLGDDYDPRSGGGELDGHNFWAPVDGHPLDASPYGVLGMAGNVEEWSDTWANHPEYPDRSTPTVRGGSFAIPLSGQILIRERRAESPSEATLARGFRTAGDASSP